MEPPRLAPRIGLVLPAGERLGRIALQVARELRAAPAFDLVGVGSVAAARRWAGSQGPAPQEGSDPRRLSEGLAGARAAGAWCVLEPAAGEAAGVAAARLVHEGLPGGWVTLDPQPQGPRLRLRAGCRVVEPLPGLPLPDLAAALREPGLPGVLVRADALLRALGARGPCAAFDLPGLPVGPVCQAARAAGAALDGPLPAGEAAASGRALVAWTQAQAELPLTLIGAGPEWCLDLRLPVAWPTEPEPAGAALAAQSLAQAAAARRPVAAEREAARRPAVSVARSVRSESDRCPYCHRALAEAPEGTGARPGAPLRCAACGTTHHRDCLAEHGRCTVLGCPGAELLRLGARLPYQGLGLEEPRERAFVGLQGDPQLGPRWLRVEAPHDDARRVPARRSLTLELPSLELVRGGPVEGYVVVRAARPFRVRGGALRLRATLHTQRLRGGPAPRTSLILDREAPFLGDGPATAFGRLQDEVLALFAGHGGVTLPAGVRRYPFAFLLDPEHPASVRNRYAEVEETVTTELEATLDRETVRVTVEIR